MLIGRAYDTLGISAKSLKIWKIEPLCTPLIFRVYRDSRIQLKRLLWEIRPKRLEFGSIFGGDTIPDKRDFVAAGDGTTLLRGRYDKFFDDFKKSVRRYNGNDANKTSPPKSVVGGKSESEWGSTEAENRIVHFKDNTIGSMKEYDSLMIYFYTTWCKHCKELKPIYGAAALLMVKEQVPGVLGAIDLTKRMDIADEFNVMAVPNMRKHGLNYGRWEIQRINIYDRNNNEYIQGSVLCGNKRITKTGETSKLHLSYSI
ncbi:UNVERIFIED_CONTAM: hypothetical protein PYX00_009807 [Menopon gallinae]|uniref:Thioredoxin domain-containing protein n=1 Tax=Menopon gallinae TaxID=328185 RepID=A0AAW2HCV9_9NEOP